MNDTPEIYAKFYTKSPKKLNCKRKPVSIHDGTLAKRLARSSEVYDFQFVGIMKKDVYNSFEKSKL